MRTFTDYPLDELREYIDWQPFFNAWEMKGKFPDILNNPTTGEAARKLYDDAQDMLDRLIKDCFDSQDYEEGVKAFSEKRRPDFSRFRAGVSV